MKSRHVYISIVLLLVTLFFTVFTPLWLPSTAATPGTVPDSHLTVTVMPDAGLNLTTWVNFIAANTVLNGSVHTSLQVTKNTAALNATVTLADALFAEYPFNVTEGQLAVDVSNNATTMTLDLGTTAPSPDVLAELLPDPELQSLLTSALNTTDLAVEVDYTPDSLQVALDTTVTANVSTLLSDVLGVPFGISTPLRMHVDYIDPTYTGNLTMMLVPGLPIDIMLAFKGNASDLCLQGTLYVPYGTYPELGVIDATTLDDYELYLEDIFPAASTVEGSLQNLTDGALTCPRSSLDREVLYEGEYLNLTLCLHAISGDLVTSLRAGFAETEIPDMSFPLDMLQGSDHLLDTATLTIEYAPDTTALTVQFQGTLSNLTLPTDDLISTLLTQLNVSNPMSTSLPTPLPVLEHANVALTYTPTDHRARLQFAATLTEYGGIPALTTVVAAQLPPPLASILTTPDATITDIATELTYNASTITASLTTTWNGDINRDVTRLKNALLAEVPTLTDPAWAIFNQTSLTLTGITGQLQLDTTTLTGYLTGLYLQPPIEEESPTTFHLTAFFDAASHLTADTPIPQLSLIGGCNGTHTVTLVPTPSTPDPVSTLTTAQDDTVMMTWRNVTLHDVQNVTFHVITGVHYTNIIVNPALISPSSPHILDATARLNTKIQITQLSDPVAFTLSPASFQETLPAPASSAVSLFDTAIQLTPSMTPDTLTYTLQMTYTDQQVQNAGVDETTLTIHYWNATTQTWTPLPSHVDSATNTVETTLTHFSSFTLTGTPIPFWTQPWFFGVLAGGGIGVAGLGIGLRRRRGSSRAVS